MTGPLAEIVTKIRYHQMIEDTGNVLKTLQSRETAPESQKKEK
jgi:hypothetical protein